jgi:hypothetical protein
MKPASSAKNLEVAATFMENLWAPRWKDVQVAVAQFGHSAGETEENNDNYNSG